MPMSFSHLVFRLFTFSLLLLQSLQNPKILSYYFATKHFAADTKFPGVVELTTQLLILENILWLPLCRINKFGLNALPSKAVAIPYTCGFRWASWNLWWRMVDDDDGGGFPSSEPRTDSRSALPRKIRAWRQLHIVKRDESFSPIFSPQTRIYGVGVEVGGASGAHEAGGAPPPSWTGCGPPDVDVPSNIHYIPK